MSGLRKLFQPVLVGSSRSGALRRALSTQIRQSAAVDIVDDSDLARMPMNGKLIVYVDDDCNATAGTNEDIGVLLAARSHVRVRVPAQLSEAAAKNGACADTSAVAKYIDHRLENARGLVSTRGDGQTAGEHGFGLGYVLRKGLARDGGLFLPASITPIPAPMVAALDTLAVGASASYATYAGAVLETLVDPEPLGSPLTLPALRAAAEAAYASPHWRSRPDNCPLVPLKLPNAPQVYMLELYHGPTCAFKDFALQLFPHLFVAATADDSRRYVIATATSGDTGVACMHGFLARGVPSTIFYPTNGVSPVQRDQMVSIAAESRAAAAAAAAAGVSGAPVAAAVPVESDFDLCQSSLKQLFNDDAYVNELRSKGVEISSANSINWGRLLPQVVYYAWAAARLRALGVDDSNGVDYCVPTGNFGNILAAYIAHRAGLMRVRRFVLASNENDVLCEFMCTGVYDISKRCLRVTTSPSIDILRSSNVERFIALLAEDVRGAPQPALVRDMMTALDKERRFALPDDLRERMQTLFWAGRADEAGAAAAVKDVFSHTGVLMDTHTAVGAKVMESWFAAQPSPVPCVLVSTAHWAKFPAAVYSAVSGDNSSAALNMAPQAAYDAIQALSVRIVVYANPFSSLSIPFSLFLNDFSLPFSLLPSPPLPVEFIPVLNTRRVPTLRAMLAR